MWRCGLHRPPSSPTQPSARPAIACAASVAASLGTHRGVPSVSRRGRHVLLLRLCVYFTHYFPLLVFILFLARQCSISQRGEF